VKIGWCLDGLGVVRLVSSRVVGVRFVSGRFGCDYVVVWACCVVLGWCLAELGGLRLGSGWVGSG